MIPTDMGPVPFTPAWYEGRDNAPVFLVRPGSPTERSQLEAEIAGEYRAGRVFGYELREALIGGVNALMADDRDFDRVLALVSGDDEAPSDADRQLLIEVREILAEHWPEYRALVARLERRREMTPLAAFRRFVVGWEIEGKPFVKGRDGRVSDEALRRIDALDILAVGNRAYALLTFNEEVAGNSARPGSSAKDPTTSPAGDTSTADGKSTDGDGPRTPASRSPRRSGRSSTSST